jgi:NAD(P)-dependent dehydrogenase (short-subunit alcohol dehydrogenase family)
VSEKGVVVVTGGGNGIGAAIAEELGRQGHFVVTLDPMVTLDGSAGAASGEPTTADRIVAAGGAARAVGISVTDADAVTNLFDDLVDEFRGVDGVINVAGISRPTGFARGSEEDWRSVLDVHLNGYRNILEAALPVMADARHGRIVGVTSGSGWRAADAGAYSCAKRAVASLTWQLGWQAPPGVVINAMSPIAVTRMVTAALGGGAGAGAGAGKATGGLNLGSMPQPEELGPLAAYLVSDEPFWMSGEVLFAGGSEVAIVEQPRLLEVVRTTDVASLPHVLETVGGRAFAAAEEKQVAGGGSNPRFPGVFDDATVPEAGDVSTCAVVTDQPALGEAVAAALETRGVKCTIGATFEGNVDAIVVAMRGGEESTAATDWERTLQEHESIVDDIYADAMLIRAAADSAAAADRPVRIVTLTDATLSAGRTRAQAATQLSRSSRKATGERVAAFAVAVEAKGAERTSGELAAYLLCSTDAVALSGAELVAGDGWVGIRSHPHPSASLTFGGPEIPSWFDGALRSMVR